MFSSFGLGKKIAGGVFLLILLGLSFKLFFTVSASEVVALTYPNGTLGFYTSPGIYAQMLGSTQDFNKREKYTFEENIQFLDGAHAKIIGSVQYEVPLDKPHLLEMYQKYPTPESIEKGLIETNLQKSVYLTGRMMTSKESYAEKKGDLLFYMEDQLANGIYQTRTHSIDVPDDLDQKKSKSIVVTEVVLNNNTPIRQEKGLLDIYGIKTSNFSMKVEYDPKVEEQIQSMQKLTQDINQSIADAKKAEQRAITIAKNGEADAAQAKWDQEKINARVIAEAQQGVQTATLNRQKAEQNKLSAILEGEGEATKKKLIMSADGALQQKLSTYLESQKVWADAFKNYRGALVPSVVTGGGNGSNGGINFMEMLGAKAAKDLALDLSVPKGSSGQ